MSGPCSKCQRFTMDGVAEKMREGGWGRCLEMESTVVGRATAVSQSAACYYEPSRFVAHVIVDERVQPMACDLPDEIPFG